MNHKKFNKYLCCIAIIFLLSFITNALADRSGSVEIKNDTESKYSQVKEIDERQVLPHADVQDNSYRVKYHYRYYPCCKVYYDTVKGIFFYLEGENWEVSESLPDHLINDLEEYVNLELETDSPYLFNEKHEKKYSSKEPETEEIERKFFSKLWILLFAR